MLENITRPQMKIRRMRISCRIPKATNPHSQYVIVIAFPPQQWLHERASILRYTYTGCIITSAADKHKNANDIREKTEAFTVKNQRTVLITA